jgi:hypothetical protein
MPTKQGRCLQRRMAGAESLALHNNLSRCNSVFQGGRIRPNYHYDTPENVFAGTQQMPDHGPPSQGVEYLGLGGAHARSKAGGEDNGGGAHADRLTRPAGFVQMKVTSQARYFAGCLGFNFCFRNLQHRLKLHRMIDQAASLEGNSSP